MMLYGLGYLRCPPKLDHPAGQFSGLKLTALWMLIHTVNDLVGMRCYPLNIGRPKTLVRHFDATVFC